MEIVEKPEDANSPVDLLRPVYAKRRLWDQMGGSLLVILLSLLLTVLIFVWKGYDLRQFSSLPIGDDGDTLGNSAIIEQTMKNLLTFPNNLGYFNIYYPEKNTLAYTIAPFGIAETLLPIYLISGRNLPLTINLYFIATFVLTAWAMYLLVRYLFAAPVSVAVLAGLMTAFAQFRLMHIPHVETLSTQFLIFGLYFLHRFLDQPRAKWMAGLVIFFYLTFFSSGYLGYIFFLCAVIIAVFSLIFRWRAIRRWHVIYALIGGVVLGIISYPFISLRLSLGVSGSYDLSVIQDFSATIPQWFYGTSLLYRLLTPLVPERTLFIGIVPIVLALLAVRFSRQERRAETPSPLSSGRIVLIYSVIIVSSYLLTLGPDLRLSPDISIPSPYRLLLALPGFNSIRVPPRFILMAVIATAVLSAFTLTMLSRRQSPKRFRQIFAVCAALLVVELLPYSAVLHPDINQDRIVQNLPPVPVKAYQWLDEQPVPAALHVPAYVAYDLFYMYETRNFHDSMVNGASSFAPGWRDSIDWYAFPSDPTFDILQAHKIPYVFVHHRFLHDDQIRSLDQALTQRIKTGQLTYVTTLDDVDIYRVLSPTPRNTVIEFNEPPDGAGWNAPEVNGESSFIWTSAATVTLNAPLPAGVQGGDLAISFLTTSSMPGVRDSLSLDVSGNTIPLAKTSLDNNRIEYAGIIPQSLVDTNAGAVPLVFHTGQPVKPGEIGNSPDFRNLGVQFDWLKLMPPRSIHAIDFRAPVNGGGWEAPETKDTGSGFRWIKGTTATLELDNAGLDDLGLIFRVDQSMGDDILKSLNVRANGQPLALTSVSDTTGTTFSAIIPRQAIALRGTAVQLAFIVDHTRSPKELYPTSTDERPLAIALSNLWYYPLHDISLQMDDLPMDGGWSAPAPASDMTPYRWMTDTQAGVTLMLPADQPQTVELSVFQTPANTTANDLTFSVNGTPIPLTSSEAGGRTILTGTIPVAALAASQGGASTLTFAVDKLAPLIDDGTDSQSKFGLAFDLIRIHSSAGSHPNEVMDTLGDDMKGSGWASRETNADGTTYRWMTERTATLEIPPPGQSGLWIETQVQTAMTPEIRQSLKLAVNGQPVDWTPVGDETTGRYRAYVPAPLVRRQPVMTLAFSVDDLVSPQSLGHGTDPRPLGASVNWVKLYPDDEVSFAFDDKLNGVGWSGDEHDENGHFHWMSDTSATATIPFSPSGRDQQIVFRVAHSLKLDTLASLKLFVNGDEIYLDHDQLPIDDSLWWGVIPAGTLAKSAETSTIDLTFKVDSVSSPQQLGIGSDPRPMGVALRSVWILPPLNAAPGLSASTTALAG